MKTTRNCRLVSLLAVASALAAMSMPVSAERPMAVDDAGTLERGGAKLEFGWSRDDALKGFEGAVGYGPIDNVEVELSFGRAKDRDESPDVTVRGVGAALKWVPLQAETGLSAGLKYEYGRERVSGEGTSRANALAGLASWAFEAGPRVHVNLGREWVRGDGHADFWGWARTSRSASGCSSRSRLSARSMPARIARPGCATRSPMASRFRVRSGAAMTATSPMSVWRGSSEDGAAVSTGV